MLLSRETAVRGLIQVWSWPELVDVAYKQLGPLPYCRRFRAVTPAVRALLSQTGFLGKECPALPMEIVDIPFTPAQSSQRCSMIRKRLWVL